MHTVILCSEQRSLCQWLHWVVHYVNSWENLIIDHKDEQYKWRNILIMNTVKLWCELWTTFVWTDSPKYLQTHPRLVKQFLPTFTNASDPSVFDLTPQLSTIYSSHSKHFLSQHLIIFMLSNESCLCFSFPSNFVTLFYPYFFSYHQRSEHNGTIFNLP